MPRAKNQVYYWDNGIRVHVNRSRLTSSLNRVAKHQTRTDFEWNAIDQQVEYHNKKQTEQYHAKKQYQSIISLCDEWRDKLGIDYKE